MTMHRPLSRLFTALALAACWPGAAAQTQAEPAQAADEPVPLRYEAASRETPAEVRQGTCPIHVVNTEDRRQNKQTVGANQRGALLSGDASPWITDGLLHLKDFGYPVQRVDGNAPPTDGVLVKTSVTRAYTWQVGLKIFSTIALKAQFVDKNGVLQDKYYRAHGDKTNMWGAQAEYVTALNYGLNNLLRVMAEDLTQLCRGTRVEPYSYAGPDAKPAAR